MRVLFFSLTDPKSSVSSRLKHRKLLVFDPSDVQKWQLTGLDLVLISFLIYLSVRIP